MNFAVGYQRTINGEPFPMMVQDYISDISEVYFPWIGVATGRSEFGLMEGMPDWTAQKILEEDILQLKKNGIKLDLLLNGNCYGERAISKSFEKEILSIIDHLASIGCCPDIITTTSFFVARTIKKYCNSIEVRASINMKIGSIQAMEYASDYFDSFYMQRDLQRNIENVKSNHQWCVKHNKKLGILVNSGCLRFCPSQTFHDNLLAHSSKAEELDNVSDWNPHICHNIYADVKNYANILKATWIRPEDLDLYNDIVDFMKLATRQHSHPRKVIDAYTRRSYKGNLLDLLEPGFSYIFNPYYIDNKSFPEEWRKQFSQCDNNCYSCSFCDKTLPMVLKKYKID